MDNNKKFSNYLSIEWRKKILLYNPHFTQKGTYYTVSGFKKDNEIEPIQLRLQKKCRAFLRGTQKETGIKGLSKIIFKK